MKDDLPFVAVAPPDRAAPAHSLALLQRVGEQVGIRPEFAAVEVAGLPAVFGRIGRTVFEYVKHVGAAVALSGGADFPEVGGGHAFEFGSGAAELRAVENRLAPAQFIEH